MKKIAMAALIVLAFVSVAEARTFSFDFYGNQMSVDCYVPKPAAASKSFSQAVARDKADVDDCARALKYEASRIGAGDFSEIVFIERFVASLPDAKSLKGWVTFAETANSGTGMSRNDKIALLYALISKAGFGVQAVKSSRNYVLFLQSARQIDGTFITGSDAFYAWEPTEIMGNSSALVTDTFTIELSHDGVALNFGDFSDAPWSTGAPGDAVKFKSPEGCPASWNFSRPALPDYLEYLSNWPRGDVLGMVAYEMMKPYELDKVFGPSASKMSDLDLGNCLFKWVQINTRYPEKGEEVEDTRFAADTFVGGVGDCDEQAFLLIAALLAAKFDCSRIRMAVFGEGTPDAHMNLAVAPLSGELPEREDADNSYVEIDGKYFYFMDVALYVDVVDENGAKVDRELTNWGDLRENLPEDLMMITVGDDCE